MWSRGGCVGSRRRRARVGCSSRVRARSGSQSILSARPRSTSSHSKRIVGYRCSSSARNRRPPAPSPVRPSVASASAVEWPVLRGWIVAWLRRRVPTSSHRAKLMADARKVASRSARRSRRGREPAPQTRVGRQREWSEPSPRVSRVDGRPVDRRAHERGAFPGHVRPGLAWHGQPDLCPRTTSGPWLARGPRGSRRRIGQ